jgi:diacylglycerol kinase (ATP)
VVAVVTNAARFSCRRCGKSFRYAWRGLASVLRNQQNAWIHAGVTCLIVALGVAFGVGATEWALLALAMLAVWAAECFNTALELMGDALSPQEHPLVGAAKDAAAGAVLCAAIGNCIIDTLVFGPRILRLLGLAS